MLARAQGCLLAMVLSSAATADIAPTVRAAEPLATRQTAFSIPYRIDETAPQKPVEVQLLVSPDRGGRWELYDKVKPDRGSFVFRAPHDGEYWFCVRSVDAQGQMSPSGQPEAGLKVIVDTLAPRLDVTAERLSAGELSAQWQIVDPCLNPDSLKIEYRTNDTDPWQELAASQARILEGQNTLTGDGVWWPQNTTSPITLRIQVSDRAGNPAVTQVVVRPIRRESSAPEESGPMLGDPTQINPPRVASQPAPSPIPLPSVPPVEPPARLQEEPPRRSAALPVSNPATNDTNVGQNPFDRYRDRPSAVQNPAADAPPAAQPVQNHVATAPPAEPPSHTWPAQGAVQRPLSAAGADASPWRVGRVPGYGNSPGFVHNAATDANANRSRPAEPSGRGAFGVAGAGPAFSLADLSPAERPKMVNSRTFQIDYEIESVGSTGVARVELFGTRDGGDTWTSLGTDPDNRSPLIVTVNGEGLYGFHVVVESASGLAGSPPRPGDRPELWIGVDLTKPQATLTHTEPGANPDEMIIYWQASDQRLERRPISLYFGSRPGGPWVPISAGLENTGNYTWRMDSRVREQVYLKLEVRDEAGNLSTFETAEPLSLNRQLPQGRIRGVRPVKPTNNNDQARKPLMIENEFVR